MQNVLLDNLDCTISEQFGDLENQVNVTQLQKLKFIRHSTKVSWLINFLQNIMENNPTDKVVVVSQASLFCIYWLYLCY